MPPLPLTGTDLTIDNVIEVARGRLDNDQLAAIGEGLRRSPALAGRVAS